MFIENIPNSRQLRLTRSDMSLLVRRKTLNVTEFSKYLVPYGTAEPSWHGTDNYLFAFRSFRISRLALKPGAPLTPPPGCVLAPHR